MYPEIEKRLNPPYMRSEVLYALDLAIGHDYRSVKELRQKYPNLPRPLPLSKLAECIRIIINDPIEADRLYGKRNPGAHRKDGDKEAIAIARTMREQGKSLRAIGEVVGRSPTWVQRNL